MVWLGVYNFAPKKGKSMRKKNQNPIRLVELSALMSLIPKTAGVVKPLLLPNYTVIPFFPGAEDPVPCLRCANIDKFNRPLRTRKKSVKVLVVERANVLANIRKEQNPG